MQFKRAQSNSLGIIRVSWGSLRYEYSLIRTLEMQGTKLLGNKKNFPSISHYLVRLEMALEQESKAYYHARARFARNLLTSLDSNDHIREGRCPDKKKFYFFLMERISWRGLLSSTSETKLYLTGLALFPVDQIMRLFQTRIKGQGSQGGGRDGADHDRVTIPLHQPVTVGVSSQKPW